VWDKLNGANDFADCELAWSNLQDSVRKFEYRWQGMLVQNASDRHDRIHPTQKPVGLFSAILERYAPPGALVFDPFSGSGTTAIACHNLGLDFVCVEKDPDYHAASVARLEKHRAQMLLPLGSPPTTEQGEFLW
jgi:DNA modification methylase